MTLVSELKTFYYIIAATLLLFFGLITIRIKDRNKTANWILSILLYRLSFGCVVLFLFNTQYSFYFSGIKMLGEALRVTTGPLVFLYIKAQITYQYRFEKKEWLHFIPLSITLLSLIPLYLLNLSDIVGFINAYENFNHPISYPFFFVRMGQPAAYMAASVLLLRKHSRNMEQNYSSDIDKRSLSWMRKIIYCYVIVLVGYIVFTGLLNAVKPEVQHLADDIVNVMMFFLFFIFMYKGVTQVDIYQDVKEPQVEEIQTGEQNEKYAKSKLSGEKAWAYLNRIIQYMEEQKAYTDNDITLQKLSESLSIPAHHISQVLNQNLDKNFYDFVNTYRLEEAKKNLGDPAKSKVSISEILLECGFNSKSVFNTLFKQYTGMTPSQYRKN
ncbi:MAG: helix-turn-helix transcriptional regulator [bacterium]|nr:helix-turn-helix transcriptional regulator [bacterium]